MQRAVVVGGGAMGLGIAYVLWMSGRSVQIVEPDLERQSAVGAALRGLVEGSLSRGILVAEFADTITHRVTLVEALADVASDPDVLIEAVPESLALKQSVLSEAQSRARPGLLATNTSSISIDAIAGGLAEPGALVGMHFFNPVWGNPLVEIIVGERTSPSVLESARTLVESVGKEAVVVRDRPGFASSRLGVLLGLEAIRMVEEGVAKPGDIDRAMELGYRHPMGPLRLTDLVGLDVRLAIAENLAATYGARYDPPALLRQLVREGHLGKKSGQGFYRWSDEPVA